MKLMVESIVEQFDVASLRYSSDGVDDNALVIESVNLSNYIRELEEENSNLLSTNEWLEKELKRIRTGD
jgi:hypothetical protein